MPNIKSAKKRVKVISAKTLQNKMVKSELKTIIKKADAATAEKIGMLNHVCAEEELKDAVY